eukprot:TRINITY_DN1998_c0_g6_i3.p1 TRINITY_DN1998_c0_g6~~TRINITY_DN1998_c0_g6_i3.p1  ORF type:complete len:647 (-),score=102.14 TRINITY_DN1998_c0_g6_i3:343-2283(-)
MIRRPPRSTLSSSSAASDVYKRQYQRRVRGKGYIMGPSSLPHPAFPVSTALLAMAIVLCRETIDALMPGADSSRLHGDANPTERRNVQWRWSWVTGVLLLLWCVEIPSGFVGHGIDKLHLLGAIVVLPLCLTWKPSHLGASQVAMHLVLLTNLANLPSSHEEAPVTLFACSMLAWNEVTLRSLSMILLNATLANGAMLCFLGRDARVAFCAIGSLAAILIFVLRRSTTGASFLAEWELPSNLSILIDDADLTCQPTLSCSSSGKGTGHGGERPSQLGRLNNVGPSPGLSMLAGAALGRRDGNICDAIQHATDAMHEQHERHGQHPTQLTTQPSTDVPYFPRTEYPLPSFDPGLKPDRAPGSTMLRPSFYTPTPSLQEPPQPGMQQYMWNSELLLKMVSMSFDAMAQVDMRTGSLIWGNRTFQQLTLVVGAGDPEAGFQSLQALFLQRVPRTLHCSFATMRTQSSTLELWSATEISGSCPGANDVVLWSIHQPISPPQQQPPTRPSPAQSPHSPRFGHLRGPKPLSRLYEPQEQRETPGAPEEMNGNFPPASDHANPNLMILSDHGHQTSGKGKRHVLNLWRKYGEKTVQRPGSWVDPAQSTCDRLYYKCYRKDCKARLKVDLLPQSGDRVTVSAYGVHCHHVRLVR